MLKTTIVTALLCGTLGLSGSVAAQANAAPGTTALAQNPAEGITETSVTMADGSVVTTRRETVRVFASREAARNPDPAEEITETSVTMPDGSVVTTRRETVRIIASREAVYNPLAGIKLCCVPGGIGGAIGGRDVIGTSPLDSYKLYTAR
jgi:hypothetical protein